MADPYPVTSRNRLRRRHERGHYDRETVHAILDAAMICHIAYVIDGQPFCTPTSFWREGDRLYWHGSSASRMVRAQAKGLPVCLTVTHHDAVVLARSGFHHSVNYRCVMAYGQARAVTDPQAKLRAMDAFIGRFYPGRAAALRPPTVQEIKAITILEMEIENAAAKIRATGVSDEEEDYVLPVWCAVLPLRTVLGEPEQCPRQLPGVTPDASGMAGFGPGRRFDEVMLESYRTAYPAANSPGAAPR
ncbi:MAG TPA: pyridoxamine 5'-phosphate oxidase family protein [Acetobacteraceae bacterium]|nr:pyridoxamine 5'-phosphate oxidase family protein [Acetobacteraceae bacterium]